MTQTESVSNLIFTSTEANAFAIQQVDDLRTRKIVGVPFGIKAIDDKMTPWLPGYLVICTARPGHGKSTLILNHAFRYQDYLTAQAKNKTACVICSWETTIENLPLYDYGRRTGTPMSKMARGEVDDMEFESIKGAGILHSSNGLFYVGSSDRFHGKQPPMTIDVVHSCLQAIEDWAGPKSYKIGPVYLDYLQAITPARVYESKAVATGEVVEQVKKLAMDWGTQAILTAQAKPDVDKQDDPQPGADQTEWSNVPAKAGDCNFTVMRPCKYKGEGQSVGGIRVEGDMQMGVQFNKQRMGPAPFREWILFDVKTCQIKGSLETRTVNLNEE